MKKILLMLFCLMTSIGAWAVDWSTINFLGDGAQGGALANKYKVEKASGIQTIADIQHPGFATADGIYMGFEDAAFGDLRVNGEKLSYDIQGAGICLHISNFTAQETEVDVMNTDNTSVRWTFHVYYADGTDGGGSGSGSGSGSATPGASEYCGNIAVPTVDHEYCSPIIDWTTADNGDVVIKLSAGEGEDGETYFRGARGMNGQFTLSAGNIADYFEVPTAYTDKYTFTLTLKDPSNKPAAGVKINYSGQIECRSSIHTNDWSDYAFSFTYGAVCSHDAAVTGISLNTTAAEVPANKTLTLVANITPGNAGNKNITWTSSDESVATVADGVVTPVAMGITTITATTVDGGFTATCQVTVTAARATEPTAAPAAPTHDAANVKAIYSETYSANCNHGAWGGSVSFDKQDYGIKVVMNNGGYVGFVDFPALDCSTMQTFHADVWVENDASMRFVPITGQAEQGVTKNLTGGQWNSIEIDINEGAWANTTNWTNVYQLKIDNAPNLTFWINNIYFYRVPTDDTVAPTNIVATCASTTLTTATISVSAEDNSGSVLFDVKNGDTVVATGSALSGVATDIKVSGLNPGTNYNLTVYAKDAEENAAAGVAVAATTAVLPACAAPASRPADAVRKIYSDAYDTVLAHDFIKNNWSGITYTEIEVAGDHALVYTTDKARWVAFGENNDGGNSIIAADGYNDGVNKGLDVTEMEYLHVDIYSATAIPGGPVATLNDDRLAVFTHNGEGWQSYDFPLSALAADKLNNIRWMKFEGMNDTDEFVVDNVYFYKNVAAPVNVTVSAEGWATYYNAETYTMPAGLEGYIMKNEEGTIKPVLAYAAADVVPAETALLLKNEGTYTLTPATGGDASKAEGNLLHGLLAEGTTVGGNAGAKYYKLAHGENGLGWYWGADDGLGGAFIIAANKAYLVVEGAAASARFISLGGTPTAIEGIKVNADDTIFDLQGRRVKNTANGMYIVNGKKVVR